MFGIRNTTHLPLPGSEILNIDHVERQVDRYGNRAPRAAHSSPLANGHTLSPRLQSLEAGLAGIGDLAATGVVRVTDPTRSQKRALSSGKQVK